MPEETFGSFVEHLIQEHGTAGRIASGIGMSLSAFSRGVKKERTLSVENCLKLAEWAGRPPTQVLTLAGKGEVAELITRLYGKEHAPASGAERELTSLWRDLETDARNALFVLLRALAASSSKRHRRRA